MGHRPCIVHWDQKRPGEEWSQSTWGEPLKTDMFIVSIQSIKIVREALESLVLGPYSSCLLWSSKNQCPLSKLNFRQHEKEFEPIPGYSVTRHLSVVTVLPIKCYKRSTQLIFPYISTKETLIREKSSINGWHKKSSSFPFNHKKRIIQPDWKDDMAMSQNCVWNVPRCSGRMERRGFVNSVHKYKYICIPSQGYARWSYYHWLPLIFTSHLHPCCTPVQRRFALHG